MRQTIVTTLLALAGVLLLAGCQETSADTGDIQRARLIGRENLQLKKQVEAKDAEIAQLQEALEQVRAEKDAAAQQAGDTNIRIMQIVAETEKTNEQLRLENTRLREELQQLKPQ